MCGLQILIVLLGSATIAEGACRGTIRSGSRGDCVKAAQRVVGVAADGIFGPNTAGAVKDYQSCFGLGADGIVGPLTWEAISGGCSRVSCSLIRRNSGQSNCVKLIQRHVKASPIDGNFGPGTEAKVKSYQKSNGLKQDGLVGRGTWSRMLRYSAPSSQVSNGGPVSPIKNSCGCGYQGATGCSSGPASGARALANYLKAKFGDYKTEIYNCRTIRGSSNSYSLHAEGRAVDFYMFVSQGGSKVMDHLVELGRECSYGIQEVIYNRERWTTTRGRIAYRGVNPHTDHIHVSLNKCGARNFNYQ